MHNSRECDEFESLLNQFLDKGKNLRGVENQTSHPAVCSDCHELLIDYRRIFQGKSFSSSSFANSCGIADGPDGLVGAVTDCQYGDRSPISIRSQRILNSTADCGRKKNRKLVLSVGPSVVALMLILIGMFFKSPMRTGQFEDSILAKRPSLSDHSTMLVTAPRIPIQHSKQGNSSNRQSAEIDPFGPKANNAESYLKLEPIKLAVTDSRNNTESSAFATSFFLQDDLTVLGLPERKRLLAMTGTHPFFIELLECDQLKDGRLDELTIARFYPSLSGSQSLLLLRSLSSPLVITLHWLHQSFARGLSKPSAIDSGWDPVFRSTGFQYI